MDCNFAIKGLIAQREIFLINLALPWCFLLWVDIRPFKGYSVSAVVAMTDNHSLSSVPVVLGMK